MKIHDGKIHELFTIDIFSESVIVYAFQQHQSGRFEWNEFCLRKGFHGKIWV